jgi:hypothetical protein
MGGRALGFLFGSEKGLVSEKSLPAATDPLEWPDMPLFQQVPGKGDGILSPRRWLAPLPFEVFSRSRP